MELTGEVVINAPRPQVWQALNSPSVLQACIPGCEEVVDESPTLRRAKVMIKMGPVRARFSGQVQLADIDEPRSCTMGFEGSGGAAGMASGQSRVELIEESDSETPQTRVRYTVKASVGGKLGQIGGRMIDASAKALADQFFGALQAHLAPGAAAPSTSVALSPDRASASRGIAQADGARSPSADSRLQAAELRWFLWGAISMAAGVLLGATLFR